MLQKSKIHLFWLPTVRYDSKGISSFDPTVMAIIKLDQSIGPIQTQGITEIAGEAGCGKTQLCLVLALQVSVTVKPILGYSSYLYRS